MNPAAASPPGFDAGPEGRAGEGAGTDVGRLRRALAGSGERPRPMMSLEVPEPLQHLITPDFLDMLKPAAVLMPVMLDAAQPELLLTRRADSLRHHQGQISFPGGRRDEADASFAAAALREACEEVGLPPQAVEVVGYLDDYPTLSGYRITPVLGLVREAFTPRLQVEEVAELLRVPLEEVLHGPHFGQRMTERDGIEFPTYELYHGEHRIWGATAAILWELRQKVLSLA